MLTAAPKRWAQGEAVWPVDLPGTLLSGLRFLEHRAFVGLLQTGVQCSTEIAHKARVLPTIA